MITEDYVSFETAKLLKEKGFDEPCDFYISELFPSSITKYSDYGIKYKNSQKEYVYSAPTLQMAMKWLREMHNIHIAVIVTYHYFPRRYEAHIMKLKNIDDFILHQQVDFVSYEQACEAAIKYCLENLV